MSTSLIINFHLYSHPILNAQLVYAYNDFDMSTNGTSIVPVHCIRMTAIVDEERYQCSADLIDLQPNSTIYLRAQVQLKYTSGAIVSKQVYKFRTAPSTTTTKSTASSSIKFINGGDFQWTTDSGIQLSSYAAQQEPLFAIVGGDIAYENGIPYCYLRYDLWFTKWQQVMVTPTNYSIPLLTCAGNHEAAGFKRPKSDDNFYLQYFPHELGLNNSTLQRRRTYHEHVITTHTHINMLDSYVHESPANQKQFISTTMKKASELGIRNKFASYHVSLYPSRAYDTKEIVEMVKANWGPLFDQFNLTIGFENHFHSYKVTYPVKNDTRVEQGYGTVYLGDGCWGVPTGM